MTEAAPYFPDSADGPSAEAYWITAEDGLRLRAAIWPLAKPRGTILLFPGRTEYVEKYGRTAADAHAAGFAVAGIDWRGQGLSDRILDDRAMGHVVEFMDYQLDVDALLTLVRAQGLPEPYYLVAHSMGGCIGLRALYEDLPVQAAAFSGPMWGLKIRTLLRPVAWVLSWSVRMIGQGDWYAPGTGPKTYATNAAFNENVLTSDPEMWRYMRHQALSHPTLKLGGPSLHWVYEALMECAHLARRPAPSTPCVTFLGLEERVVDSRPIHARMEQWAGGALQLLPECRHEVLMERPAIRDQVWATLRTHFA